MGNIVSHSWDFGDGATSTEQSPTHTYDEQGIYIVSLTVTDDGGASNMTLQDVEVTDPTPTNTPPVASFTSSCTDLSCSFTNTSDDLIS
jgi:PKD repeat protein